MILRTNFNLSNSPKMCTQIYQSSIIIYAQYIVQNGLISILQFFIEFGRELNCLEPIVTIVH